MGENIPEDALLEAANTYRNTLLQKADGHANGTSPYWHGWAIFDAYVAGVRAERERWQAEMAALKAEVEREHRLNLPLVQELERLRSIRSGVEDGRG